MVYGEIMFHEYASLTLHPHGHPYESFEGRIWISVSCLYMLPYQRAPRLCLSLQVNTRANAVRLPTCCNFRKT